MRNRYAGKCSKCGKAVPPKAGRYRISPKQCQDFTGLRCLDCSTTTKKNVKQKKRLGIDLLV